MALFRRKKQDLTPEFQEYYQTTEQRSGMAWVLAILTLVVGVLLVVGLFLGGRWAYRRIANNDKPETASQDLVGDDAENLNPANNPNPQTPQPAPAPGQPSPAPGTPAPGQPSPNPGQPAPNPNPATAQNPNPPAPNPNPGQTPNPNPSPAPNPAPMPPPPSIPNTGPEFDL